MISNFNLLFLAFNTLVPFLIFLGLYLDFSFQFYLLKKSSHLNFKALDILDVLIKHYFFH